MSTPTKQDAVKLLDIFDPEMAALLHREEKRQFETIGLIASENVVSPMAACLEGSVFTNKNTEGYAGKRFVGGCELADQAELLAVERVKKAFGVDHANIQCGNATIANVAVLRAFLKPGDTFLGLARRSPEPRGQVPLQRGYLQRPALRGQPGDRDDRHGPGSADGFGAQAQADLCGLLLLSSPHRLQGISGDL